MAPANRAQSGCSTKSENNNPFPRGPTGLARSRLGNAKKKPVLTEYKQNQVTVQPVANPVQRVFKHDISKSTPDLSGSVLAIQSKLTLVANNMQKINSLENLARPKPKPQAFNRPPAKPSGLELGKFRPGIESKKPKRVDVVKKTVLDSKRGQKPIENKRKLKCMEPHLKMAKELHSPTSFQYSASPPKNRLDDCLKIVQNILLERSDPSRISGEFEDSIGAFNTEEITDLLASDSLKQLDLSRLSSELDDSISSLISDQMILNLVKSNDFVGSKQKLYNSLSEELDSPTPGPSGLSNEIGRTPSAEDLPMECEVEANPIIAAPEAVSARSTSPELPQESLSSRTTNAAVSIITSVTSIMSLDTGYQGDGELSRPESRNTENESRLKLPIAENGIPVKTINFDDGKTMTDSDFFTESDADVHDDLSAAAAEIGSGKGDRKAQVIDGTLYGGGFIQTHSTVRHNNYPNVTVSDPRLVPACNSTNEDMESSGIYSDLEKKPEEVQPLVPYLGLITDQIKTIQELAQLVAEQKAQSGNIVKSSSGESSNTVQEVTSSVKTTSKPERESSEQPKKSKMPNRNVTSKIKSLIQSQTNESEVRTKTPKKGKWDAVMNKIAQGKEENKYSPSKYRDIKSKVFQNIGPLLNGRNSEHDAKAPPSGQSKSRSRRSTRIRSSESSLVTPKSKLSKTSDSPNSSQQSSLSDISLSGNPHHKSTPRGSKKRESISPQSYETNTSNRKLNKKDEVTTTTPYRNSDLQNGNVVPAPISTPLATMKTPIRKTPTPGRSDSLGKTLHRTSSVPLKDSNHNGIVSKSGSAVIINNNNSTHKNNNNNKVKSASSFQSKSPKVGTRGSIPSQELAVVKEANKALLKQLKHNSRAFESLAILFAYCTNDLDAFANPHLKHKLDTERGKLVQAQSDLEELQSRLIRFREELNDKELVITELKNDNVSLNERSENFRKLVEQLQEELTEEKHKAENECEKLRQDLNDRTESYETEKNDLVFCLGETKKENNALKTVIAELKEEYNKCLVEKQSLAELIVQKEKEIVGKENIEEEVTRTKRNELKEKSPGRKTPEHKKAIRVPHNDILNSSSLESEVESLRQVLALKTDEVTELRRQEMALRETADRVPKLLSTITMLEGKVEDIQTQLSSQTETVRDLLKSNDQLEKELNSVNIQKTRLTHRNEELEYKLKQYAEAMQHLANQKDLSDKSITAEFSPLKSASKKTDPVKSHMKAVVEKSDSVSYMLQMTEDSSEIVTNIIRRAGSFRPTNRDTPHPKKKRSKATSVSSIESDMFKKNSPSNEFFKPENMSTPSLNKIDFRSPGSYKALSPVKLNRDDFSTDSIELLSNDSDCEVIEITENFDKVDKMATSTSSSGSSLNGSHFDIDSDVFSNLENDQNLHDLDTEDTESSEIQDNRTIVQETQKKVVALPVYTNDDGVESTGVESSKNSVKMPKVSGGEAMIGLSSDDEDKIKLDT